MKYYGGSTWYFSLSAATSRHLHAPPRGSGEDGKCKLILPHPRFQQNCRDRPIQTFGVVDFCVRSGVGFDCFVGFSADFQVM